MTHGDATASRRRWTRMAIVSGLAIMVLASAVFVLLAIDSSGLVVVRNALLAQRADRAVFEWTPEHTPADFKQAHGPVPKVFNPIVAQILQTSADDSNLSRALAIASHLRENRGDGEGIHSDTVKAYWAIRNDHTGYCADFTQVFSGLAYAANIPVREWAISWKEWGKGHAFSEIFEPRLKKWVLVDSFNSLYMVDATSRTPLSTLEVHDRLTQSNGAGIEVIPIVPRSFQFQTAPMAIDYYRAGINELSLWWGSDVFGLDATPMMRTGGLLSRLLDPLMSVLLGARPNLKLLTTHQNIDDVKYLMLVKYVFIGAFSALIAGAVLLIIGLARILRDRRSPASPQASVA